MLIKSVYSRNNRTRASLLSLLVAILFVSACGGQESGGQESEQGGLGLSGATWVGVVNDEESGPIKVELTELEKAAISLHYGTPRSCRLHAEEVLTEGSQVTLKFDEASGGFCDKLFQGVMTIDKQSGSMWAVEVRKNSIQFSEGFTVKKQ